MKVKQVGALLLSAILLVGCTSNNASETTTPSDGGMTAGTYTSTQSGYAGEFDVTVTVDASSITDITIGENSETEAIGGMAIEQLPQTIIDAQSVAVDGVSGATFTSDAIIAGVKDCLTQAGADMSKFETASGETTTGEEITMDKDVVIVGAGAAGLTAAIRLKDQGVDNIIVLEQMAHTGGASATCGGGFLAAGTAIQSEDSVEGLIDEITTKGHELNDMELTEVHAQTSGETLTWLMDTTAVEMNEPAEGSYDYTAVGGGAQFMATLADYATTQGIEILLNTKAETLIYDESGMNGVMGVTASDTEGNTYTINSKYVILATGGYGANTEMTEGANIGRVIYYGPVSSDGSGIQMAQDVAAVTRNMEYVGVKPNGLEISDGVGKYTQPANNAMWKASAGFSVNKQGERVVNEQASEAELVAAYKQQDDWALYTVMDPTAYEVFHSTAIEKHLLSDADIEKWFEEKGTGTTIFVHGESVEDAATQAGIDPVALQTTIDEFNAGIEAGNDEFGREVTMTFDDSGEIYIIKQNLRFATTLGGLDVTTDMQVQDGTGTVIPGLYAAGEVVGAEQGDASTGYLSWASTSGYIAANAISTALSE